MLTYSNWSIHVSFLLREWSSSKEGFGRKKIFIPTLWSNVLDFDECELEKDYVRNILPLPIDQRYGTNDIMKILEELKNV